MVQYLMIYTSVDYLFMNVHDPCYDHLFVSFYDDEMGMIGDMEVSYRNCTFCSSVFEYHAAAFLKNIFGTPKNPNAKLFI